MALVGGREHHTMGTIGPHANAKDRVGMCWLGGAFCGRHDGKICSNQAIVYPGNLDSPSQQRGFGLMP
jgi:hypothetical protein